MIDKERVPYQISSLDRVVGVVIVIALLIAGVALVRHFRVIAVPTEDVIKYYSLLNRSYGITKGADIRLAGIVRKLFPLSPEAIIAHLDLKRPIYRLTAAYGHFGRELDEFTWERTDKVDELKELASK